MWSTLTDNEVINSWGSQRAQPHIEIDDYTEVSSEFSAQWDRERREAQAAERTKLYPDVYVNGEDVTVTVDPMKNERWMRDDSSWWRHHSSQHRGALKDHRAVMDTARSLDRQECVSSRGGVCIVGQSMPATTFIPTSRMIDAMDKLSPMCVANSTRGYSRLRSNADGAGVLYDGADGQPFEHERWGKLPVISEQIYKNALPEQYCVEPSLWVENAPLTYNRADNRAFDCGEWGVCR